MAHPTGTLIGYGGGGDTALLAELTARLRHDGRPVEIIPTATRTKPLATGRAYVAALHARGFSNVRVLRVDERYPADRPATLKRAAAAGLILLPGGDQERLTDFLHGTQLLKLLHQRYQTDGLVLAGTSAGAAALPGQMIVAGYGWRALLAGRVRVIPGLGFAPGLFFDQHFTERDRFTRLAHAVLRHPRHLGLGLGEETGVVLHAGQLTVFGEGVVTVLDGRQSKAPGLAELAPDEPISGRDLRLHLLTAGQQLTLETTGGR